MADHDDLSILSRRDLMAGAGMLLSGGTNESLPVLQQGHLWKRGRLRRSWKERWFVLDAASSTLTYFEDRAGKKQKGRVALTSASAAERSKAGGAGAWELNAGNKRVYKFKTSGGADERDAWIAAINDVVDFS